MTDGGSSAEQLLAQQARRESNARTYPRSLPLAIERADGAILEDVDGNEYIDCLAGAGTLALGHNHPAVVERMEELLERGRAIHTLDLTTPVKERFVDRLLESLPDEFAETAKVQFCSPAGTDAVEAALKLVKTATGNRSMLAFQGGYHGMTHGALGLMGDTAAKEDVPGLMPNVQHLPYPYAYRCPFGLGGEACWRTSAEYVERTLSNPDSGVVDPAGMILEPVQGEGGAVPAPADWLREMRRITRERDVPLIVDEIQTGLGRTGELYGIEYADVVPDVMTLSKAVGGGLPLSVVVYDESLDVWEPGAHAGTFRGNQLGMAAGAATIEYVLENDLEDHAAAMGDRLRDRLEETAATFEAVGDVRGRGLMLGMELVDPDGEPDSLGHYPADGDLASAVQSAAFDRGLVVETGGRDGSVVRFLPPLTISPSRIDTVAEIVHESVRAALTARQDRAEAPA
ncbi:2,4-diaminobutyrate 4-transaminase [Natrinema pellirubrum DSM 15624]|uniref:2,4-diaminobutyrate 4-transaminase n=1 Tax=Natrinema pellirubrum (strain DSM 15624 / CIP 106293 / JCM 10476 / NCIMB 786 / 157) TaxID=797303 RepID=L0JT15_NATP1|nr:diaminobutyrate--2-oxoglutarate transaminase [Natrinema pellirubrum]AGB33526.1 2,4-diaminobutyrate 4-transaminase [Natrinema pellirubrum DSM 15624]ELY70689.1 2,4-diaminobutyrate 4-transaminase [Natrinema pellirubrum DSM 15624]